MSKLPKRPDLNRLASLNPALRNLRSGQLWHRIYHRGGERPTQWHALRFNGPTMARFDHHRPAKRGRPRTQARGVMYVAGDIPTCLAEAFQCNREVDLRDRRPWLASFRLRSTLVLLDLTGGFAAELEASAALLTGPRRYARNWARGFYEAYPMIDGLYFNSTFTGRSALALFERAAFKPTFPVTPSFHRSLADPLLLVPIQEACADIGYSLSPRTRY